MRRTIWAAGAAALALALAGCGGGGSASGGGGHGAAAWNVLDACSILDKSAVAGAVGQPVTGAALDEVSKGEGGMGSRSSCTYTLGDGKTVKFTARSWPEATNTPEQLAQARDAAKGMSDPLPGVGKLALWNKPMRILSVFFNDAQYVDLVFGSGMDEAKAKAAAIELAHKAGA